MKRLFKDNERASAKLENILRYFSEKCTGIPIAFCIYFRISAKLLIQIKIYIYLCKMWKGKWKKNCKKVPSPDYFWSWKSISTACHIDILIFSYSHRWRSTVTIQNIWRNCNDKNVSLKYFYKKKKNEMSINSSKWFMALDLYSGKKGKMGDAHTYTR